METQKPWVVIGRNQTSVGAREWILRWETTTAHVFDLPHGGGVLVVFTDAAAVEVRLQGLRAEAHAARCYALACDKIVDLAEFGHLLDARPVRVGGGHLEIKGSDALVSLRFYFENAFSAVDLAKGKPCCEENDR